MVNDVNAPFADANLSIPDLARGFGLPWLIVIDGFLRDPEAVRRKALELTYREALRCELLRAQVFEGRKAPMVFGQPDTWRSATSAIRPKQDRSSAVAPAAGDEAANRAAMSTLSMRPW
mgnify:CR=1 FL=1